MENIGRYKIIAELGRGGMATVYRAYDPQFEREVAIKVLPPQFLHDLSFAKRFNDEARTIARLEHRCILPVYDFGEVDGTPYIVMRLMMHGSLSDEIRGRGPMPAARVTRIIGQAADALDYAHSKNIVHRDLKPANLLLDEAGNVYLGDFGLAKLIGETQQAEGTMVAGTPAYMAPEQALGQMPTPRTDVYALGALAFELLAGQPPFQAPDILALMFLHAHEPVPRLKAFRQDAPDGVQAVLEQAMMKAPDKRFATAGEFARALSSQLGNVTEPSRETQEQQLPQDRRRPTVATTLLAAPNTSRLRWSWIATASVGLIAISICSVVAIALSASLGRLTHAVTLPTLTPTLETGLPRSKFDSTFTPAAPTSNIQTQVVTLAQTPAPSSTTQLTNQSANVQSTTAALATQAGSLTAPTMTATEALTTPVGTANPAVFVQHYFALIINRQYEQSWSLLSDGYKLHTNGPDNGGYQGYVNFWNGIAHVDITTTEVLVWQTDLARVRADVHYDLAQGGTQEYEITYFLIPDNKNSWLIDATPYTRIN